MKLSFKRLTLETWKDFEQLFGENGACAGCWCMYWLMRRKEYDEKRKDGRTKTEMKKLVKDGTVPGIIAYDINEPIGWIAIQPRENYPVLNNSKILAPVDDKPVWSIVCFYIDKNYRRNGVSVELIKQAVKFAEKNKAKIVEAYPVEPKTEKAAPPFIWTGTASAFKKAGFTEVVRRSETRPVMRFEIK
jgi:GNAT superfamily N-acetyltransferase